jgi:hypothetical protein
MIRHDWATVVHVQGSALRVRRGPSQFDCQLASSLPANQVQVGDTVLIVWVDDRPYAFATTRARAA